MRLSFRLQPLGLYGPAVRVRRGYGILELVRVLRFEPLAGWRSDQPGAARLTRSSAGSYPYVGHRMARVSGGRAAIRSTAREVFISGAAIPRRSMSVRLTATTSSCPASSVIGIRNHVLVLLSWFWNCSTPTTPASSPSTAL